MTLWQLAQKSLFHFRRTNLALLIGIAIATAVLTGALIVGDSVRLSLRSLTQERLGRIDELLLGSQFFRVELADALAEKMPSRYTAAIPAILVNQATLERTEGNATSRAQSVTVLGVTETFWSLDITRAAGQSVAVGEDQIAINDALAEELNAKVGDKLILRIGKTQGLAADSPLARKSDLVRSLVDLEIVEILPTKGLARFSLQASQQVPANAFVALSTLQSGLDQDGNANAIFVASEELDRAASGGTFVNLQSALDPSLSDLGLSLERITLEYQSDGEMVPVLQYQSLINDRMLFSPDQSKAVEAALANTPHQPLFTYLATKLQKVDGDGKPFGEIVPYSTITAVDPQARLGPVLDENGAPVEIQDDEIVLNSWTAESLDAVLRDNIRVTYFEPESSHGDPVELAADFVLKAIQPVTEPDRPFSRRRKAMFVTPPTVANDPDLTPRVGGVTDAETIDRWDAPFPMDRSLITGADDDYWLYYRTTPKAFISLSSGKRLWGSRFGDVTSFRSATSLGSSTLDEARLQASLAKSASAFDLNWIRARKDGLAASSGTTPFDGLFLGFSFFIIASALILVSLLLRLSLEQRAKQVGLLQAIGFNWNRTFAALFLELLILVILGGILGVALGAAYAWLMLIGLKTWWVAAIVTPFMTLNVTPKSALLGFALGATAALLTMGVTLWRFRNIAVSRLMSGETTDDMAVYEPPKKWGAYIPLAFLGLSVVLGLIAPTLPPEPQGGVFFGAGACVLIALLWWAARAMRGEITAASGGSMDLRTLAYRNLTRNPTRSVLTIGLVASACFLIVAMSAFRLSPTEEGTGGFESVGTSDQPLFGDALAASTGLLGLRLQDGDDASCRNLYQSKRPRLIGITPEFIGKAASVGEMEWASALDEKAGWAMLDAGSNSEAIPVVIDKNTAMYGMQIYTGVGTEFERDYGDAGTLRFRIVGLLAGSIFQGSLLIPEERLLEHFPRVAGYRYFLLDANGEDADAAVTKLESQFSDEGLDLTSTTALLEELLAVQNTYLSTFQSLGGLGLLLGTLGLAAVQIRNVIQRRGELALMRATGFRNSQLNGLLFWEHGMLLLGGLLIGTIAALVVVLPHMLFGGASVPLLSLFGTLVLVALVGLVSVVLAQQALRNSPILDSLRDS